MTVYPTHIWFLLFYSPSKMSRRSSRQDFFTSNPATSRTLNLHVILILTVNSIPIPTTLALTIESREINGHRETKGLVAVRNQSRIYQRPPGSRKNNPVLFFFHTSGL